MKRPNKIHCSILALLCGISGTGASASAVIPVSSQSCKYSVELPQGWDTIPQTVLKEKLPEFKVDLGIYPSAQEDCFSGNYAIFVFLPAQQPLTGFPFSQIVSDITQQNQQGEIKNDTLHVRFIKTVSEIKDERYSLYSYYKIQHHSDSLDYCQLLRPARFGYVSAFAYTKPEGMMPAEEVALLTSAAISIHPDYAYSEPRNKGIGLKHILISAAIGVLVYLLIAGIPKLKKQR